MRTMMKVKIPVEAGNRCIKDGSIGKILGGVAEAIKPEAAYFGSSNGKRTAYYVFNLKDPSQIPSIAEPLFNQLNAEIEFMPVMNADDLMKGVSQLPR
jgi:hypothetical protein